MDSRYYCTHFRLYKKHIGRLFRKMILGETAEIVIESGFYRETKERKIKNDTDIRAFRGNR